ncbi:YbjN domain-containing protein [Corynebacterium gallinarum]|uniref:YbjN domain-containing protein n=1 Tax=Corynebacterium gallinarum TaxID=2762214 RepID=A0A8I0L9R2_9CORY|nr:YbjN domain-containing protein [Corynebacterium gallinarum]MBD8028892.1 YbjN domain-containing protein [Corynebacterium gallinarum]
MPDTLLPRPVDLDRVEDAVDALGYQFLAADDRLLLPWPNHRISMYFGHESGVHLTMLARMRMSLDLSMINDVAHALNRWNTERIAPAAMLHVGDLGEIEIRFRSSLSVDEGVSTDQLLQFIQLTINTVEMAVDTVMELFSELDITGAGSEELRAEQDEEDLVAEIVGLWGPPSANRHGFERGSESRNMDTPRHPSSHHDDHDDHPDAEVPGSPGGEDGSEPVRETPDEPFLPIFSEFAGTDLTGGSDESAGSSGPAAGRHRDDDDDEDLLDLLASMRDHGDEETTGFDPVIPAIGDSSVTLPSDDDDHDAGDLTDMTDIGDRDLYDLEDNHAEYPREVTLDRVRDHLADIGVVKTSGEDDFLVAWINEVFIGFFIDNGPTFLVKGHWDPDMDPDRDFIKLFMMCNQWNERSLTTKAFCHKDTQGLQVRVEFAVPTAEGLTDGQLRHNIALSIHHILQAVDSLSIEATGSSIVDWPDQN